MGVSDRFDASSASTPSDAHVLIPSVKHYFQIALLLFGLFAFGFILTIGVYHFAISDSELAVLNVLIFQWVIMGSALITVFINSSRQIRNQIQSFVERSPSNQHCMGITVVESGCRLVSTGWLALNDTHLEYARDRSKPNEVETIQLSDIHSVHSPNGIFSRSLIIISYHLPSAQQATELHLKVLHRDTWKDCILQSKAATTHV